MGCHCEVNDCNQRDFLPFTCDVCTKKFCLIHRTYAAHYCIGASMKDMTSMDCPICLKSIKFPKSDSADAVWNDHFLNSCSQEASTSKQIEKCYKRSCSMRLGPSNTIVCKSCRQKVCMSHRIPEEHDCQGMRGAILSRLPPAAIAVNKPSTKPPKPSTQIGISAVNNPSAAVAKAATTTSKSSTSGQSEKKTSVTATTIPYSAPAPVPSNSSIQVTACPFCAQSFSDMQLLEVHISAEHPDPTILSSMSSHTTTPSSRLTSSSSHSSTSSSSIVPPVTTPSLMNDYVSGPSLTTGVGALGREVCPICQARFVDPVELVIHFEQVHPQMQASATSSSGGSTGTSSSDCIIA